MRFAMALDLSIVGKSGTPFSFDYRWQDAALYALGVGAKRTELDFLYEARGPKVLPSFVSAANYAALGEAIDRVGANKAMLVHGGQKMVFHALPKASGRLVSASTVRAVYDLKRLAQMVVDIETRDEANELVAVATASIILRGEGGFGGDAPVKEPAAAAVPKDLAPEFSIEETTSLEQALLFRLSGDLNPLHADPEFAAEVGFTQGPILHGLATYGFMVRHVIQGACGGDAARLHMIDGQFRKPVWPGDTLVTLGWQIQPGLWALQVKVKERDEAVITGAWAQTG
jgi:acyl dehydratase